MTPSATDKGLTWVVDKHAAIVWVEIMSWEGLKFKWNVRGLFAFWQYVNALVYFLTCFNLLMIKRTIEQLCINRCVLCKGNILKLIFDTEISDFLIHNISLHLKEIWTSRPGTLSRALKWLNNISDTWRIQIAHYLSLIPANCFLSQFEWNFRIFFLVKSSVKSFLIFTYCAQFPRQDIIFHYFLFLASHRFTNYPVLNQSSFTVEACTLASCQMQSQKAKHWICVVLIGDLVLTKFIVSEKRSGDEWICLHCNAIHCVNVLQTENDECIC